MRHDSILIPPASEVLGKVMFSQAFVYPRGRGGLCMMSLSEGGLSLGDLCLGDLCLGSLCVGHLCRRGVSVIEVSVREPTSLEQKDTHPIW